MSTSDSDYSIDWLASDEEDYDSPKRLSPEHVAEPTSSSRESPPSCFHSVAPQRTRGDARDCRDGGAAQRRPLSPPQGFTSVYTQHTLPVESRANRKRRRSAGLDELCEKPQADTENELFLLKCSELQCYIPPLSSILQGLRSGRYSDRLSSFQESVAMDRIQRILGVLQNPNMGGRFLGIVLKVEEMLHSWFPQVRANLQTQHNAAANKRKQQQHHSASPPSSPAASLSSSHLTCLHSSSVCSMKSAESAFAPPTTTTTSSPSSSSSSSAFPSSSSSASSSSAASSSSSSSSHADTWRKRDVTQDNAVSSSTDPAPPGSQRRSAARPRPRPSQGALPFKISSPCLERLLKAKDSIIGPRAAGESGWLS